MLQSWRLTLVHTGDGFETQSVEQLESRTTGGFWLDPDDTKSRRVSGRPVVGRFIELRDAKGRTIYRRDITETAPDTLEFPTGNSDRPLGRIPMPKGKLLFIRVPANERATSAAVVEESVPKGRKAKDAGKEDDSDIVRKVLIEVELRARNFGQEEKR